MTTERSTIDFSMETVISNMDIPNKDKERLYLDVLRQKGVVDGTVVWSKGKIVGFRPNQSMGRISLTIKVGEQVTEVDDGKETN